MTQPPYGPPPQPVAPARPLTRPLDAAAAVLLGLAVAALLLGGVLGFRGFQLLAEADRSTRICQNDGTSMGECLLAVDNRKLAAGALTSQGGAAGAAGVVLLVAGTWRGTVVVRYRRAGGV